LRHVQADKKQQVSRCQLAEAKTIIFMIFPMRTGSGRTDFLSFFLARVKKAIASRTLLQGAPHLRQGPHLQLLGRSYFT